MTTQSLNDELDSVREIALRAQGASRVVALTPTDLRDASLRAMAQILRDRAEDVLAANLLDVERGIKNGMNAGLVDRLRLTKERIEGMAQALESLADMTDPLGNVLDERTIEEDLILRRVSVPLGVVAMVYEARPNVTVDAAGICIKTGNACVLRGGSQAIQTNTVLTQLLREAVQATGIPEDAICSILTTNRSDTDELMSLHGIVDVLIPRGGAGLIQHCVEHSLVPVIETGTGNCHTYIHKTADAVMAKNIVMNAKTQRVGVCNACESILVDEAFDTDALIDILAALVEEGVMIHVDERIMHCIQEASPEDSPLRTGALVVPATEEDWGTEYLALEVSVKMVSGVNEAIAHIGTYGTGHSECIVASPDMAEGKTAIADFYAGVDAAVVYANASTRFTDGGCFGLGAEIGISTQKLHARGPFALEALTSYKYLIEGTGQVRH